MTLTHLFSPLRVGSVEFKNRIFSTGHQTGLVVVSMGHERNAGLEAALADYAGEAPPPIGDCLVPRAVEEAVVEALEVATAI